MIGWRWGAFLCECAFECVMIVRAMAVWREVREDNDSGVKIISKKNMRQAFRTVLSGVE